MLMFSLALPPFRDLSCPVVALHWPSPVLFYRSTLRRFPYPTEHDEVLLPSCLVGQDREWNDCTVLFCARF